MKTYLITLVTVTALLAVTSFAWAQGLEAPSADLPADGPYVSLTDYFQWSAAGTILDDPVLEPFVGTTIRQTIGNDEIETFDAELTGVEIGMGYGTITLTGPVEMIHFDRALSTAGLFDAEIISMSLSGNTPGGLLEVRQDSTRASIGQTDIADLGGGLYHIDSFFDVFTELRMGGGNWIASDSSTHMVLTPEPCTMALLALGAVALIRRRK